MLILCDGYARLKGFGEKKNIYAFGPEATNMNQQLLVSTGCLNDSVVHTHSELLAFLLSVECVRSVGSNIHVFVPPTQHWLRELSSDDDGFLVLTSLIKY